MQNKYRAPIVALCTATGVALALGACGESIAAVADNQPALNARAKSIITVEGRQFKDLNANGKLDPYEDWRLTAEERSADLLSQMTPQEKAGMLMIDTLNAGCG